MQAPHTTLSQLTPASHTVPLATLVRPSTQFGLPEEQSVAPALHGLGLPLHTEPCAQAMHEPAPLHTMPASHASPGLRLLGESAQAWAPEEQLVMPCLHAMGLSEHSAPAMQLTQNPEG